MHALRSMSLPPPPSFPATVSPPQLAPLQLVSEHRVGLQTITLRASTLRDLWREMATLEELPPTCGLCGSIDLMPAYRRVREFEFFSLACRACGGYLKLGQRQDGGLFPKRHLGWFPAITASPSTHS